MKMTPRERAGSLANTSPGDGPSSSWNSRVAALLADPDNQLDWDNDLGYHVARALQELRAHRGLTQAELAERAGTTQPRIALAESGDANLTLRVLRRYLDALGARALMSFPPIECAALRLPAWWDLADMIPETQHPVTGKCTFHVGTSFVAAGWTTTPNPTIPGQTYLIEPSDTFTADSAKLSPQAEGLFSARISDEAFA